MSPTEVLIRIPNSIRSSEIILSRRLDHCAREKTSSEENLTSHPRLTLVVSGRIHVRILYLYLY
jgi:hypothetical protein